MYAQRKYPKTIQGTGPYTISQVGCFLTSFSNLCKRLGRNHKSPKFLNKKFTQEKIYVNGNELYWGAITKHYGDIVVVKTGTSQVPPNANSIVKIDTNANTFGTHFCLVKRIRGKKVTIIDSWDGHEKDAAVYGKIVGWATYKRK